MTAIGVNVATNNPNRWVGWVMIVTGIALQGVGFLAIPK
jgi:hypothetical protein